VTADARELLEAEEAGWRDLQQAFGRVPRDAFETPGLTSDGWSAKVALYHVAAWMEDCAEQLEAMRAGTFDGRIDTVPWIDEQNRRQFDRTREIPADAVRSFADRARDRMRGALHGLPALTPDAVEWFEESGALHYHKHVRDLRGWAERLHSAAPNRP
jgi:hypothetical protein